ncbi:MAG TPA: peptidase S41, partial [Saprospiraceae bacterium]|nr:peptidase S41 [Saprospiraceae bacterium]
VWSKDSKQIAFASDRYGNFDVYIMASDGGQATRLTYHSNSEIPYTFNHDNTQVIFGAARQDEVRHRQYPTASQPEVYAVSTKGGKVNQMWTLPAEHLCLSKDGKKILYHDKKGGEHEWRKHHKSGIARDIWLFDGDTNLHTQLTTNADEDRNPVFSANEQNYYYLSEKSGTFNVHKRSLNAQGNEQQITSFNTHPVRFLSISNENMLCYGYHGSIYTQKEGENPKRIAIKIITQEVSNNDSYIKINGGVQEMEISSNGKEIAVIARGELFITSIDGQMTKRITNTSSQERFLSFDNGGKAIYYAREVNNKWGIFKSTIVRNDEPFFFASTIIKEEPVLVNDNENYMPKISPDGKKIAFIENRRTLKVYTLASKSFSTLLTSNELFHMGDGDQYFNWSPDSKWLLASYNPTMANSEVVLLSADGKEKMKNLTQSGYSDIRAKWVNNGKQMLWLSNKEGLKSLATSGATQMDVYTMFFTKDSWDKFNMTKDEFELFKEIEKVNKENTKKQESEKKITEAVKPISKNTKQKSKNELIVADTTQKDTTLDKIIKFDWEDIEKRKAKLTIHSSLLADAILSKDGEKLYYLARFEKDINLWTTDLRTKETKMLIKLDAKSGQLRWDPKVENLYLLSDGSISKVDLDKANTKSIKIAGDMILDEVAQRERMFEHVWIRNQGSFYTSQMHGVDWFKMKEAYQPYVKQLANSYEFADLIGEMLGELNVSHSGARYSANMPNGDETASIGIFIDYYYSGQGIKIAEIIKGGP